MRVIQFVNSFVNRQGNIGIRTGQILEKMNNGGVCVCRGAEGHVSGVDYREMGCIGHIPRILNAVRIYLMPKFNHRFFDIALFECFALYQFKSIKPYNGINIAHVWDICPKLIRKLKSKGLQVVLDIPMAPAAYGERLYKENKVSFLRPGKSIQKMQWRAFSLADRLLAPSQFVKQELIKLGVSKKKVTVVEFGVTVHKPGKKKLKKEHNNTKSIDFCFVGNVNRRKGIPELLKVWEQPEFFNDRLHLCGRIHPDVKKNIKKVKERVITPGYINTFDYLKDCNVFVLPSWMEGSSKAIYEAMASGLPVITTYSAGSVVRDGVDGFVIEAGDVCALTYCMLWFKKYPEKILIMGEAARDRALEYTWGRYAHRVFRCYEGLIKHKR